MFILKIKNYLKALILFTIGYFIVYFYRPIDFFRTYNMLFFYFTIGGIAAIVKDHSITQSNTKYLIYIGVLVYFFSNFLKQNLSLPFYHMIGMILIPSFILTITLFPLRVLESKSLYYLGTISYGIYMLNPIVIQSIGFVFMKKIIVIEGTLFVIVFNLLVVLFTILVAAISHKYFEFFFMNMRKKLINKE